MKPILICGDDPLLIAEAREKICARLKTMAYTLHQVYRINANFNWDQILNQSNNFELFDSKQIIELWVAAVDAKTLKLQLPKISNSKSQHQFILIHDQFTNKHKQAAWYKLLAQAADLHTCKAPNLVEMPTWVSTRFRQAGFKISLDVAKIIAQSYYNNLYGVINALQQLRELYPDQDSLNRSEIEPIIHMSSSYTVFDLLEVIENCDLGGTIRIFEGLISEGVENNLIIWGLARQTRMYLELKQGTDPRVLKTYNLWPSRLQKVQAGMQKKSISFLQNLLASLGRADQYQKTFAKNDCIAILQQVSINLAGSNSLYLGESAYA